MERYGSYEYGKWAAKYLYTGNLLTDEYKCFHTTGPHVQNIEHIIAMKIKLIYHRINVNHIYMNHV